MTFVIYLLKQMKQKFVAIKKDDSVSTLRVAAVRLVAETESSKIEMHFLPDVYVPCEVCHGKRYNSETLEVHYKGKNIADILEMTVEDAVEFFKHIPKIHRKLQTIVDVGLGYVTMGATSNDAIWW